MNLIELNSSFPLVNNKSLDHRDYLTPKASIKFNPGDMKNHKNEDRTINVDNIFNPNRIGFTDSFEQGESLTLGLDYKKENLKNINKYFETKIATVLRNDNEEFIPTKTTLNKKSSNIFGSVSVKNFDFFDFGYNFSIDNNLDRFEYNSIDLNLNLNNFSSQTTFIEENGVMGNTNVIENDTTYKINSQNKLGFNIRRNREINLTEYYNLVYEYENDCLIAGVKYNKVYYQDRDLKPSQNLIFTITFYPLTNFERKISE